MVRRKDKKAKKEQSRLSRDMNVPEDILLQVLTRLPLGSIIRFKLVCKEWKSLMESAFFLHLYHKSIPNSASPYWSILRAECRSFDSHLKELELSFPHESHGNNWSFENVFRKHHHIDHKRNIKEVRVVSCADGLVLLRLEFTDESTCYYYVGNPVLSQWIELPCPPLPIPQDGGCFYDCGLVTGMHNGVILGYKVVRLHENVRYYDTKSLRFEIYSSDTGEWSRKQVSCPGFDHHFLMIYENPISLNGKLYWQADYPSILVYDFFSDDDQARTIRLTDIMREHDRDHIFRAGCTVTCVFPCYKRIFSVSQGFFVFIEAGLMPSNKKAYNVRVWRLKCDSWEWEKCWEINMTCFEYCVPVAINNFDIDIIYLWNLLDRCYIACNVRTHSKYHGLRLCGDPDPAYKELIISFYPVSIVSQFVLSLQELKELGLGLEESQRPFIWVIRGWEKYNELAEWISESGYKERIKERGLLIRGWSPQMLILSHPAVGGFLTHCGWNSTLEGITSGVPLLTWPLFGDQFCNEKLVVQVLKVGVRSGVEDPMRWGEEEKIGVLVDKEGVKKAVEELMGESDDAEERRRRAKELGELAHKAVEEKGSSHSNITSVLQDIRQVQSKQ